MTHSRSVGQLDRKYKYAKNQQKTSSNRRNIVLYLKDSNADVRNLTGNSLNSRLHVLSENMAKVL